MQALFIGQTYIDVTFLTDRMPSGDEKHGRRARVIAPSALNRVLRYVSRHPDPTRSRVILLLSVKAGLRAAEIAKLEWSMVLDANCRIGDVIEVRDGIAKKGAGRTIPIHPDLRASLARLLRDGARDGPVIQSSRGGAMRPNSIVNWFVVLYRETGLDGCSSHSGRRTFITHAARLLHKSGGSLRDIQLLAGHRSIDTTQGYIDGDSHAQRKLISLL
jgi:integrase/recombinase XerD